MSCKGVKTILFVLCFCSIATTVSCSNTPTFKEAAQITGNLVISDSVFSDRFDLTEMLEYELIAPKNKQAVVEANIVFQGCMFEKSFVAYKQKDNYRHTVMFKRNLVFIDCIFQDSVDLSNVTIEGDLICENSKFAGAVLLNNSWLKGLNNNLKKTTFYSKLNLSGATIDNKISFFNAVFENQSIFYRTTFRGYVNFGGAEFQAYSSFENANYTAYADYSKARFKENVSFDNAKFGLETSFMQSEFSKKTSYEGACFLGHADFRGCVFSTPVKLVAEQFALELPNELKNTKKDEKD